MFVCVSAATEKQPEREEPYEEIVVDEDPYGTKLLKTDKPLEEASKIVMLLQREASQNVLTWVLSYQIAIRQGESVPSYRHGRESSCAISEMQQSTCKLCAPSGLPNR